jgi:surface carbohydrate biosynthesis protein
MNIYIHVEIAARELDSKLLLASRAARRGHTVVLANLATLKKLLSRGILPPGIFHTKSLTPKAAKVGFHSQLHSAGHAVTSIDEEAGIALDEYETFVTSRYGPETLDSASAVFCWGRQDFESLLARYPRHSHLMHLTGSPRCDLWQKRFRSYWPAVEPFDTPYLLVASNFGLPLGYQTFSQTIDWHRTRKLLPSDLEQYLYINTGENLRMIYEFVRAIVHLSERMCDLPIVLRPHPAEDPTAWRQLLPEKPNIHVMREGPITPWLHNCLALMHNGCTSAIESFVAGVPVITYRPFKREYELAAANCIGTEAAGLDRLCDLVKAMHEGNPAPSETAKATKAVQYRLHYDEDTLAADRIVDIWEQLGTSVAPAPVNRKTIAAFVGRRRFAKWRDKFSGGRHAAEVEKVNVKFPPFQQASLEAQLQSLASCLNENEIPEVKVLDQRLAIIAPTGSGTR